MKALNSINVKQLDRFLFWCRKNEVYTFNNKDWTLKLNRGCPNSYVRIRNAMCQALYYKEMLMEITKDPAVIPYWYSRLLDIDCYITCFEFLIESKKLN